MHFFAFPFFIFLKFPTFKKIYVFLYIIFEIKNAKSIDFP